MAFRPRLRTTAREGDWGIWFLVRRLVTVSRLCFDRFHPFFWSTNRSSSVLRGTKKLPLLSINMHLSSPSYWFGFILSGSNIQPSELKSSYFICRCHIPTSVIATPWTPALDWMGPGKQRERSQSGAKREASQLVGLAQNWSLTNLTIPVHRS